MLRPRRDRLELDTDAAGVAGPEEGVFAVSVLDVVGGRVRTFDPYFPHLRAGVRAVLDRRLFGLVLPFTERWGGGIAAKASGFCWEDSARDAFSRERDFDHAFAVVELEGRALGAARPWSEGDFDAARAQLGTEVWSEQPSEMTWKVELPAIETDLTVTVEAE